MQREDEWNEFKKTTGELNEAMVLESGGIDNFGPCENSQKIVA